MHDEQFDERRRAGEKDRRHARRDDTPTVARAARGSVNGLEAVLRQAV